MRLSRLVESAEGQGWSIFHSVGVPTAMLRGKIFRGHVWLDGLCSSIMGPTPVWSVIVDRGSRKHGLSTMGDLDHVMDFVTRYYEEVEGQAPPPFDELEEFREESIAFHRSRGAE